MPEQPGEPPIKEGDAVSMPAIPEAPSILPEVPAEADETLPHVMNFDPNATNAERPSTRIIDGQPGVAASSMDVRHLARRINDNLSAAAKEALPDEDRKRALEVAKRLNEAANAMGKSDTLPVDSE